MSVLLELVLGRVTEIQLFYAFFSIAIAIFLTYRSSRLSKAHSNPPPAPGIIPKISCLLGLALNGSEYFTQLSKKTNEPVVSCDTIGIKIHFIQAPEAVQAVFKNQNLSTLSLGLLFAHRVGGAPSSFTSKLLGEARAASNENYWHDMNKVVRDQLAGGESLRQMTSRVLSSFYHGVLNGMEAETTIPNFYIWLWRRMVRTKTDALFGEMNPFRSEEVLDHYWNFEQNHLDLFYRPMPSVFAKDTYRSREEILNVFRRFSKHYARYDMGDDVSNLIKARTAINRKWGIDLNGTASTELSLLFGATANAFPTLYWMIIYIFHDQDLLSALRHEVSGIVEIGENNQCVVDTAKLDRCAILGSSYRETLRLVSRQPGARVVDRDTVITFAMHGDVHQKYAYRLGAGDLIQMPAGLLHRSESIWGREAQAFDGRRFLDSSSVLHADRVRKLAQKNAYIPFGGGKHYCPGRRFAYIEILSIVVSLVLGFELSRTGGDDGDVVAVPDQRHRLGLGIVLPDACSCDLSVKMRRRRGWEDKVWGFKS